MKNTLKSIFYKLAGTKLLVALFIALAVLMMVLCVMGAKNGQTSGMYVANSFYMIMFPVIMVGVIVGVICCSDRKDKVANYEILSGHSREQFYFTRFLFSVLPAAFLAYVLSFVPMIFGNLIYGWGDRLVFSEVLTRQLLCIFPLLRLAAFFVCISFLVRNEMLVIAAGFGTSFVMPMMFSFFPKASKSVFISVYNLNALMAFKNWEIYNVTSSGIVEYKTGVSTIEPNMVIGTIAVSLVMTVVYMILGYGLFRRSDME